MSLWHEGKEIDQRLVPLTATKTTTTFAIEQKRPGLYRYDLRAEPITGESSLLNNTDTLLLRVVDEPIRVLLLEGKPYWDSRFLMRTLAQDAVVEVDSLVRVSDKRLYLRTLRRGAEEKESAGKETWKTLASAEEQLKDLEALRTYQIIVLGRDADIFLGGPLLEHLRTWIVRDSGCLVCARGQPVSQLEQRLGQLLPVRWRPTSEARFHPQLTERGRELQWFPETAGAEQPFAALPSLATTARPEQPQPLAIVLATTTTGEAEAPVVSYQPFGMGRVVVLEGGGMWRWAFLPPQQQQQETLYQGLWHSLLRWLVSSADLLPGQKIALRSDKVRFNKGEPASATLLVREETNAAAIPSIELRGSGPPRTVQPVPLGDSPGAYRVPFGPLPEGRYEARVAGTAGQGATATLFDVRTASDEALDLQARPELMQRIAQESGGSVVPAASAEQTVLQFHPDQDHQQAQRVRRTPAWDRWWVLLAIWTVWGIAWAVRRSSGLI